MGGKRWYVADALGADLTNRHHHIRAASEAEVERRMRKRYPKAAAILVLLEESWRQNPASVTPEARR
ncbi:MAG TPA: hypothetical protein VGV91_09590 [Rubrobacter sp.]|nr:hypothetical protein [Rubrobacter sp.]